MTLIYEPSRGFLKEGAPFSPCHTGLILRSDSKETDLASWTSQSKSTIEVIIIDPNRGEGLTNVTSRSSTDVLSRRSFLAAYLDLGSWAGKKVRSRRSRHPQVGHTLQDPSAQQVLPVR